MEKVNSSFRDPSGFVFKKDGKIFRFIDESYKDNFSFSITSGLYDELVKNKLIVSHEIIDDNIIEPRLIKYISYPYEWCFSQLKDAALLTLKIQKIALKYGMSLKDASAYNIQFLEGKPIFIDTLSFEKWNNSTWIAYSQFCRHFLSPLALMAYKDVRLNQLLRVYMDGIPTDLSNCLLPFKWSLLTHIKFNANLQSKLDNKPTKIKPIIIRKEGIEFLINDLEKIIKKIKLKQTTYWQKYYDFTNYSRISFENKRYIIEDFISNSKGKNILDLGCNTGEFGIHLSKLGYDIISVDNDHGSIENLYSKNNERIIPLLIDLTNPSSNLGFAEKERDSFSSRFRVDYVLALALIHHLRIANNIPFYNIAEYFNNLGENLIIEYIPKEDSQIEKMLLNREDIFKDYNKNNFEKSFKKFYNIIKEKKIEGSMRTLYLMKRKVLGGQEYA